MSSIISDVSNRASQGLQACSSRLPASPVPPALPATPDSCSHAPQHPAAAALPSAGPAEAFAPGPDTPPCLYGMADASSFSTPVGQGMRGPTVLKFNHDYNLDVDEYEALMLAMQQSLMDSTSSGTDALQQQLASDPAAGDSDDDEEEVAAMLDAMTLQPPDSQASLAVLCPICKAAYLQLLTDGRVRCSGSHALELDLQQVSLDQLRDRMAGALEAHALSECQGFPKFATLTHPGRTGLVLHCDVCQCWQALL